MDEYDASQWHDMFTMTGGAAAALAGLIFVAISVNHEQVLASSKLPLLAARTLAVLVGLVVLCVLVLAPGQTARVLGIEVSTLGVLLLAVVAVCTVRGDPEATLLQQLDDYVAGFAATVPTVVGGLSLVARAGGGLYWLMAEVVTALVATIFYAWVLLIEIRR